MMMPFITGSRAYGEPRPDSDLDLVIRVDKPTRRALRLIKDKGAAALMYGDLNLILCETDERYWAWWDGTQKLIQKSRKEGRPIHKGEAHKTFADLGALHSGEGADPDSGQGKENPDETPGA